MASESIDFDDPKYYQNRELSWLDFNERVIAEATDPRNPLLEQLRFLSIGSSNLDEFISVRVAGLIDQEKLGVKETDSKKQWTASKQLEEIAKRNNDVVGYQYDIYHSKMKEFKDLGIEVFDASEISPAEDAFLKKFFKEQLQPGITPYGIDAYRPFPHLNDGVIYIFVHLKRDGNSYEAIVPIPSLFDRIQLIEIDGKRSIFFT